MANNIEIIKITSTLVPDYDGQGDKLKNVTSALNALSTLVTDDTEPIAVQVILSKLTKKARSAVGDNPANIAEIVTKLEAKCSSVISSETVLNKLKKTKQTGSLGKFLTEIEDFADKLEAALLLENYSAEHAEKVANKAAISALREGLRNERTQLAMEVGTFAKLSEAIAKATEIDSKAPIANVYYQNQTGNRGGFISGNRYNNNDHQNHNNRYNNNGYQNQNNRFNNNGYQNQNNRYNNNGYQNQNNRYNNNAPQSYYNNDNRGGFGNNRNRQNNQNNQNTSGTGRQVLLNRTGNGQIPQQNNQVGGQQINPPNVTIAQVQNRQ